MKKILRTKKSYNRLSILIVRNLEIFESQCEWWNRRIKNAWLRRKTNMKVKNRILGVGDIFRRFPGALRFVVANPVYQIVEFAACWNRESRI